MEEVFKEFQEFATNTANEINKTRKQEYNHPFTALTESQRRIDKYNSIVHPKIMKILNQINDISDRKKINLKLSQESVHICNSILL